MSIELDIERLVLDGIQLTYRDRQELRASLEAELERLLTEGGLNATIVGGGFLKSTPASAIEWTPQHDLETLGKQIAQSVYEGLGK